MRNRLPLLLLSGALVTACTGSPDDRDEEAVPVPSAAACASAEPAELPAACLGEDDPEDFDVVASPTGAAPAGSAAIPAATLPPAPTDLAAGGNDKDPSKTSETFVVTVPAGSRLVTTAVCEGRNSIQVEVEPESAAAQEFACGFEGAAAELTVEDSEVVSAPTRFTVTVTTTPPSRWYVAVGATDEPAPPAT